MRALRFCFVPVVLGILACGETRSSPSPDPDPPPPREVPLFFVVADESAGEIELHALDADGRHRILTSADAPAAVLARLEDFTSWSHTDVKLHPSPDGRSVAWTCFECARSEFDGPVSAPLEILDLASDDGRAPSLARFQIDHNQRVLWSKDGRWLAIAGPTGPANRAWGRIAIVNARGETRSQLELSNFYGFSYLAWSPDSSTLAYGVGSDFYGIEQTVGPSLEHLDLHTVSLDGVDVEIASDAVLCRGPRWDAVWSPDGARVLYQELSPATEDPSTATVRFHAARRDGSGAKTLLEVPWLDYVEEANELGFYPNCSWAKSGDAVALAVPNRLVLSNIETGESSTIVEVPKYGYFQDGNPFRWSPRGDLVAYGAIVGDSKVLRTIDPNGRNEREWGSGSVWDPIVWFWGATGNALFGFSGASSLQELHTADIDAGRDFLLVPSMGTSLDGIGFSPDGSRIAFPDGTRMVSTHLDGSDSVEILWQYGYMADGRHVAAARENALSLQALGEPPQVVWQGDSTRRVVWVEFPIAGSQVDRIEPY